MRRAETGAGEVIISSSNYHTYIVSYLYLKIRIHTFRAYSWPGVKASFKVAIREALISTPIA
jgi:hypothetical protein